MLATAVTSGSNRQPDCQDASRRSSIGDQLDTGLSARRAIADLAADRSRQSPGIENVDDDGSGDQADRRWQSPSATVRRSCAVVIATAKLSYRRRSRQSASHGCGDVASVARRGESPRLERHERSAAQRLSALQAEVAIGACASVRQASRLVPGQQSRAAQSSTSRFASMVDARRAMPGHAAAHIIARNCGTVGRSFGVARSLRTGRRRLPRIVTLATIGHASSATANAVGMCHGCARPLTITSWQKSEWLGKPNTGDVSDRGASERMLDALRSQARMRLAEPYSLTTYSLRVVSRTSQLPLKPGLSRKLSPARTVLASPPSSEITETPDRMWQNSHSSYSMRHFPGVASQMPA